MLWVHRKELTQENVHFVTLMRPSTKQGIRMECPFSCNIEAKLMHNYSSMQIALRSNK